LNPDFKVVDIPAIKLCKANKFGHVTHYFRSRPRLEQLVLGLRRPIPVGAHIVPHEFKLPGEDETFAEA
jgi:hypothetical protein